MCAVDKKMFFKKTIRCDWDIALMKWWKKIFQKQSEHTPDTSGKKEEPNAEK